MVGVDRKVIEHKLMIKPGTKETKQEKKFRGETGIGQSTWRLLN